LLVGNKSNYNNKRKKRNKRRKIMPEDMPLITEEMAADGQQTGVPNFTQSEMEVFMVLAEYSQEIERLRMMVLALGGDPDARYTSEDLGGRVGDQQPDPELAKMNEEMTYE
jgi:hypothetical protein